MKKIVLGVITGIFVTAAAMVSYAGEWKADENGWWYDNGDGTYPENQWKWIDGDLDGIAECYYFGHNCYMVHDTWVGDYYLGSDGAMLTNTTIPDGYVVGADGKRIQEKNELPVAPYYQYQTSPDLIINGGSTGAGYHGTGYGFIDGNRNDIIEYEDYYEIKNQSLSVIKQYDNPEDKNAEYHILPNGKYGRSEYDGWYESDVIYYGSFYIRKDAKVHYIDVINDDVVNCIVDLKKYFEKSGKIISTVKDYISAYIVEEDDKGYIVEILIKQAG